MSTGGTSNASNFDPDMSVHTVHLTKKEIYLLAQGLFLTVLASDAEQMTAAAMNPQQVSHAVWGAAMSEPGQNGINRRIAPLATALADVTSNNQREAPA